MKAPPLSNLVKHGHAVIPAAALDSVAASERVHASAGDDSMNLPHAHTCFNLLSIPEYGSRGKLRDRLTIAIHNSQGFGLQ
eukprot:270117-Pleurochrysis_carterae.AAC.1